MRRLKGEIHVENTLFLALLASAKREIRNLFRVLMKNSNYIQHSNVLNLAFIVRIYYTT